MDTNCLRYKAFSKIHNRNEISMDITLLTKTIFHPDDGFEGQVAWRGKISEGEFGALYLRKKYSGDKCKTQEGK